MFVVRYRTKSRYFEPKSKKVGGPSPILASSLGVLGAMPPPPLTASLVRDLNLSKGLGWVVKINLSKGLFGLKSFGSLVPRTR